MIMKALCKSILVQQVLSLGAVALLVFAELVVTNAVLCYHFTIKL